MERIKEDGGHPQMTKTENEPIDKGIFFLKGQNFHM